MNGVIYCRVSSKEQIEGTSLESQEQACLEYAKSKNINVLKIFVEQGESAKFADRTQLLELLNFCRQKKGQIDVLLVWKVDRFARNVGDHFNIKATLSKYGVQIVSVTEPIDPNPEGQLMETILAGFAQFDNDIRAARTVQGMRKKIQDGIFPWKPPLGYISTIGRREKKNEPDQPDHQLFPLLRKAWDEYATGAYTKMEILRMMQSWGVLTRKGKPMNPQSLDAFFTNKYYAGALTDPWSGLEYAGKHEPLVSIEKFAKVQQVIKGKARSVPHQKIREEFPLRGLIRCAHCAHYLTASFSRGRSQRYPYYRCNLTSCQFQGKSYPAPPIHEAFELRLNYISPKSEIIDSLVHEIVVVAGQRHGMVDAKNTRSKNQVAQIDTQIHELIGMRSQKLISDQQFMTQKNMLTDQKLSFLAKPNHASFNVDQITKSLAGITAPLTKLRETWKTLPLLLKRRFQQLIFPVGFLLGQIETVELGLLFSAFKQFGDEKSNAVPFIRANWNPICEEIQHLSKVISLYQEGIEASKRGVLFPYDEDTLDEIFESSCREE